MDRVLEQLGRAQRQRAAAGGTAAPDLDAFWVLSIDVCGRTSAFQELPCGWVGERPDSAHLLGMLGAASAEAVHPACYVGVGRALGKEPLKVAPYTVSSNFLGHRLVVWTRDDLPPPPTRLPAVQCVLGKLTSTPKRGDKVFLALYPRVPNSSHQPGATPVPGTVSRCNTATARTCTRWTLAARSARRWTTASSSSSTSLCQSWTLGLWARFR
jgi:hypothetical protein